MHLGSWSLGQTGIETAPNQRGESLVFHARTFTRQGLPADADSAPSYRVYEDNASSPLDTGTMNLLDSGNTEGLYEAVVPLTDVSGYEAGKTYTIYIEATVGGVTATGSHQFQIHKAADVKAVDGFDQLDLLQRSVQNNWLVVKQCTVNDGGPTSSVFSVQTRANLEGTNQAMDSYAANYFAGFVCAFLVDELNEWQTRRVDASAVIGGGLADLTVDPPFSVAPANGDELILLGRIEPEG